MGLFPGAHLPLPAVGVHGEEAQALELEFVKGAGGEDGSVNQGVVHHAQGGLAGGGRDRAGTAPLSPPPQFLLPAGPGEQEEGLRGKGCLPVGLGAQLLQHSRD